MGVASSPGPDRSSPARHSIRFTFAIMVAVPVVFLVALWGVAVGLTPAGTVVRRGLFSSSHPGLSDIAIFAGGALIVVLLAAVLMGLFARRLSRDLSALEASARHLADKQLPQVVRTLRDRGPAAEVDRSFARPSTKTTEIARTAAAIAGLQHTAITAAEDEASLRSGVAQVFVSLARRNQSLLQKQLSLIDALEQKAADPAALADLFLLDHFTTRMRRHAENLIILAGEPPGRSWSEPVPVIDVLRGAVAEVEEYQRIRVVTRAPDAVTGSAVADMIHLLAELIENAALFSPSGTRVELRAERVANGFAIEVEDRGLGIQPDLLAGINKQLLDPADFGLADPDRLGLFVVGKLAVRHGIRVELKPSPYGGITAVALMPHSVVVPAAETGTSELHGVTGKRAGVERRSRDALVLTGRHAGPPAPAEDVTDQPAAALGGAGTSPASPRSFGPASPDASARSFTRGSADASAPSFGTGSPDASTPSFGTGSPDASTPSFGTGSPLDADSPADRPSRPSAPGPGSSASLFTPGPAPSPGTQAAGTYRGLPRRVRQASLSQHLRNNAGPDTAAAQAGSAPEPSSDRTPETARDFVASFRTGWQRDQGTDTPDTPLEAGPGATGREDSAPPQGEDT